MRWNLALAAKKSAAKYLRDLAKKSIYWGLVPSRAMDDSIDHKLRSRGSVHVDRMIATMLLKSHHTNCKTIYP
jgi:hypothetical protein